MEALTCPMFNSCGNLQHVNNSHVGHPYRRAEMHAGRVAYCPTALSDNVRTVADPVKFRKLLKSHYFRTASSVC